MDPAATPPEREPSATAKARVESTEFILAPSAPDNMPDGASATA